MSYTGSVTAVHRYTSGLSTEKLSAGLTVISVTCKRVWKGRLKATQVLFTAAAVFNREYLLQSLTVT